MYHFHSQLDKIEPTFSIILPTWNNIDYIKKCVESIRKNSSHPHQIILHINEGTDGTVEWARKEGLDFSHSDTNVGICVACNLAASLATAPYIMYMNDDMYVCPDWDTNLLKAIKEYGKDDFYFSATMIEWKDMANPCVAKATDFGHTPEEFREDELLATYKSLYRSDWQGASWPPSVMHRSMWHIIGGFSIEFSPGMHSDPDISMKLWQAGCRNYRGIGNSLVYHFMSKSTLRVKKNDGQKQFLLKWGISARMFYKYYTHIGKEYMGILPLPTDDIKMKFLRAKYKWKKLISF